MAEAMTREQVQAEWWARWWEEDFSWAGLAAKPVGADGFDLIHGGLHGEQDLQAYWRRDPVSDARRDDAALEAAGELLRAPDGALWHLAHVPLHWRDGSAAKAGWNEARRARLAALVAARVAAGAETAVNEWCLAMGPDGRAQLAGAVLLAPPEAAGGAALHLVLDWAWVPGWYASGWQFGPGFRVYNSGCFSLAIFTGATFSGTARFDNATFFESAWFSIATFSGDASFTSATFSGDASFHSATFSRGACFDRATFSDEASFDRTTFSGEASFDGATFEKWLSFTSAQFKGDALFTPIRQWPAAAEGWHRAFDNAQIHNLLSFEGSGQRLFASFDGIRFLGNAMLRLDKPESEDAAKQQFRLEGRKAYELGRKEGMAAAKWDSAPSPWDYFTQPAKRSAYRARLNDRLEELEGGCRALKKYFEDHGDKARAQLFYRFEIEARRMQPATSGPEKLFSHAYRIFSGYGAAIFRPIGALLASVPLFAVVYWLVAAIWADSLVPKKENGSPAYEVQSFRDVVDLIGQHQYGSISIGPMLGALSFSAQRVFPIGPWEVKAEDEEKDANMRLLLLGKGETLPHLGIRFLGTLQSIFALAMAFLSGIAIRRRFQMD
jgi:hypothetical protein